MVKINSIFFLFLLVNISCLPLNAHIIHLSHWKKDLPDGKKQDIYCFGDRHMYTQELDSYEETIKNAARQQQKDVLAWAHKLKATILVEDLFHYPSNKRILKPLNWFINKVLFRENSCVTFLKDMVINCEQQKIPVINIESRRNSTIALITSSFSLSVTTNFFINTLIKAVWKYTQRKWYHDESIPLIDENTNLLQASAILGGLFTTTTLPPLYNFYKERSALFASIEQSPEKEFLSHIIPELKASYKEQFPLTTNELGNLFLNFEFQYCGWQLELQSLTHILSPDAPSTNFICAGDLHIKNIEHYLQEKGFTLEQVIIDKLCYASNYSYVALDADLNIEKFMTEATK